MEMTRLATMDNPHFEVSDIEILRPGISYTVDTMSDFNEQYGDHTELFFIMGGDSICEIETWKEPDRIMSLCTIIATSRPGFDLDHIDRKLKQKLLIKEIPHIDISSTQIRQRVQEEKSITYLVPKSVEAYILRQGLYQSPSPPQERKQS